MSSAAPRAFAFAAFTSAKTYVAGGGCGENPRSWRWSVVRRGRPIEQGLARCVSPRQRKRGATIRRAARGRRAGRAVRPAAVRWGTVHDGWRCGRGGAADGAGLAGGAARVPGCGSAAGALGAGSPACPTARAAPRRSARARGAQGRLRSPAVPAGRTGSGRISMDRAGCGCVAVLRRAPRSAIAHRGSPPPDVPMVPRFGKGWSVPRRLASLEGRPVMRVKTGRPFRPLARLQAASTAAPAGPAALDPPLPAPYRGATPSRGPSRRQPPSVPITRKR